MNKGVGRASRSDAKAIFYGSIATNFRLLLWLKDRFGSKRLYKLMQSGVFPESFARSSLIVPEQVSQFGGNNGDTCASRAEVVMSTTLRIVGSSNLVDLCPSRSGALFRERPDPLIAQAIRKPRAPPPIKKASGYGLLFFFQFLFKQCSRLVFTLRRGIARGRHAGKPPAAFTLLK